MDRRNFMRSILGVAAATALPSEVWPFRKIFLPTYPQRWVGVDYGIGDYVAVWTTANENGLYRIVDITDWTKVKIEARLIG